MLIPEHNVLPLKYLEIKSSRMHFFQIHPRIEYMYFHNSADFTVCIVFSVCTRFSLFWTPKIQNF